MPSTIRRTVSAGALCLIAALAGCSSGPKTEAGSVPAPAPVSQLAAEQLSPFVRPLDTLTISVLREPDLSPGEVLVNESGGFMMPLIGWVDAAGNTPESIAENIRARMAERYLVNPQVTVNVAGYGSHLVTVEGSVNDPGIYDFKQGTTLMGAVALASGPKDTISDLGEVALFRTIEGETMVAVYDLKLIRAGQMGDPLIHPGDRVVIGFSTLGEGLKNFLSTVPALGLFTRF